MNTDILKMVIFFSLTFFMCCHFVESQGAIDWFVSSLDTEESFSRDISSRPEIVNSPFGSALRFNGVDDALFLQDMPLKNLNSFTVEMIFKPAIDGHFEQRVLHIGEVSGDRMLLEIRALHGFWYFDGFVKSEANKKALVDEVLLHKLGDWHHVAFVVEPDQLTTYVNGICEVKESFQFKPIQTGQTSIGVRLNKQSFFKGDIYRIRITPKSLKPKDFLPLK